MGGKVLIVDDRDSVREILAECLEVGGYDTESVSSEDEALERIRFSPPDLILADALISEANGYQFCKSARAVHDVPIIMLCSMGEMEWQAAGEGLVDGLIAKPFGLQELLDEVEAVMRHRWDEVVSISAVAS